MPTNLNNGKMKAEAQKQLDDTMLILEDFFFMKAQNSSIRIENEGDKGWFYMSENTAVKLKRLLIKYKISKI